MSHQFRLYGKKRGQRRTGSRRLGIFGEAIFFLLLVGLGASGLLYMLLQHALPEWRANRHFVALECEVLATRVVPRNSEEGIQFRTDYCSHCDGSA